MQTVSDVPVGLFLSGGIDSSSLAGILSRAGIRLNTFSIIFVRRDTAKRNTPAWRPGCLDRTPGDRGVAGRCARRHSVCAQGHGPAHHRRSQQYLIARQTRAAGISGAFRSGWNEMFAGYSSFRDIPGMERFDRFLGYWPSTLRRPWARMFAALASNTDQNRNLTALGGQDKAIHPYFLARALFTPEQRAALASVDKGALARANAPLQEACAILASDPVNRVSYLESRCYMLNTLLRDCDVMSMAHGLELRVPLIDHQLADKLMAMPGAWNWTAMCRNRCWSGC